MGVAARINVKRDASGLTVEIEAPRLAQYVQDYCKRQLARGPGTPETPDMRHLGEIWPPCNANGAGKGAKALSFMTRWRGSDGPFIEGESAGAEFGPDSVNLFLLRSTKALEGPVVYTFKGLYSRESADKYLEAAYKAMQVAFKELTAKYDKTVVLNEVPQEAVPASGPVAADAQPQF
jgi:hypothetical protein